MQGKSANEPFEFIHPPPSNYRSNSRYSQSSSSDFSSDKNRNTNYYFGVGKKSNNQYNNNEHFNNINNNDINSRSNFENKNNNNNNFNKFLPSYRSQEPNYSNSTAPPLYGNKNKNNSNNQKYFNVQPDPVNITNNKNNNYNGNIGNKNSYNNNNINNNNCNNKSNSPSLFCRNKFIPFAKLKRMFNSDKRFNYGPKSLFFCLVLENPFYKYMKKSNLIEKHRLNLSLEDGAAMMPRKRPSFTSSDNDDDENGGDGGDNGKGGGLRKSSYTDANNSGVNLCQNDTGNANKNIKIDEEVHWADESTFIGYVNSDNGEKETYLKDDDFLLTRGQIMNKKEHPSDFMKIIEIIYRLYYRGFDLLPPGMIAEHSPSTDPSHAVKGNLFHGLSLCLDSLILSPDADEIYIKIHGCEKQLLDFAENEQLQLRTNDLSAFGGALRPYSKEANNLLIHSIEENLRLFKREKKEKNEITKSHSSLNLKQIYKDALLTVKDIGSDEEKDEFDNLDNEGGIGGGGGGGSRIGSGGNASPSSTASSPSSSVKKRKDKSLLRSGFRFDVSDKMRIIEAIIRTPWEYGGAGLQVYEMQNKGILVKHFFPLHNKAYQKAYGLDQWASFRALYRCDCFCHCCASKKKKTKQSGKGALCCTSGGGGDVRGPVVDENVSGDDGSNGDEIEYKDYNDQGKIKRIKVLGGHVRLHPCYQNHLNIIAYFGESIALYFYWLHEMIKFLPPLALLGLIAFIINMLHVLPKSLTNGVFAILTVIWGFGWNSRWHRLEQEYACRHGQKELTADECVRDEFRAKNQRLYYEDLYRLNFKPPLTVYRNNEHQLINRYYPNLKRTLIRWFVSYPIIIILTAVMVAVLTVITYYRFKFADKGNYISYLASFLSIITSLVFGLIFNFAIAFFVWAENIRTESEVEEEMALKSFFFAFFSNYYALFLIALFPDISNASTTNTQRLKELESQMIMICVVKPAIQNLQETVVPFIFTNLRRRIDTFGGFLGGIGSYFRCKRLPELPKTDRVFLWRQSQRQPYPSLYGDYLEIAIQFGYMVMFAAVFPLSPLLALFYNIVEIRVDAYKLLHVHQRPVCRPACTIGGWKYILFVLSGFSVVTNSYLICVLSPAANRVGVPGTKENSYIAFILLQYIFILFGIIWIVYASGKPDLVKKVEAKHRLLLEERMLKSTVKLLEASPSESSQILLQQKPPETQQQQQRPPVTQRQNSYQPEQINKEEIINDS